MINVCVIGYGYWGPNLCRNFSNANGYSLKAICDLNPANLTKAKKNFPSVSVYKNFKDALSHKKF
jgi:predicted dehydrogenase